MRIFLGKLKRIRKVGLLHCHMGKLKIFFKIFVNYYFSIRMNSQKLLVILIVHLDFRWRPMMYFNWYNHMIIIQMIIIRLWRTWFFNPPLWIWDGIFVDIWVRVLFAKLFQLYLWIDQGVFRNSSGQYQLLNQCFLVICAMKPVWKMGSGCG